MLSRSGSIIWGEARKLIKVHGEYETLKTLMEVKKTMEDRGVFSNRSYKDEEIEQMAREEFLRIINHIQVEEC